MIALIDCNSFFCSVERAFHPGLWDKPVCVLSNNDGIIVALTTEAKNAGLHRGDAIFKVMDIVRANNVSLFSTNLVLYNAMSQRIVSILRGSVGKVEQYSIDECFAYLDAHERLHEPTDFMREIAERIKLWTDIPVSVGIAPSKTLAKMASKFAKKHKGYRSVCAIDTDEKRRKALELFDLSDVWGIGGRTFEKLRYLGIATPIQLADKPESWVRSHFNKPVIQTWMELNGIPCIDTQEVKKKQTICTSRSFGEMVQEWDSLRAAVVSFASSCANKLRAQNSVCMEVTVFISSNPFREELEQYGNCARTTLITPTSDTTEITAAAVAILAAIYRPTISYKKAGVIVGGISDSSSIQLDLFDPITNRKERSQLMTTIDNLNHRYGIKTVKLAAEGGDDERWRSKRDRCSPNYLTSLEDLLTV